jgi:hypothetical protein
MITPGAGVRIWLAAGVTDMRRGFDGLGKRPASRPCFMHWDRCSVAGWLIEMKQPH